MKLTEEQARAVDLFQASTSLKISAFAGTGKTSTLSAIGRSTNKSGLYLAFNKSIATEAQTKFPRTVDCRTTHSLAFRAAPSAFKERPGKLTDKLQGNLVAQTLKLQEIVYANVTLKPRSVGYLTARTVQRFCHSGDERITPKHVPLSGKLEVLPGEERDRFRTYLADLAAHLWERMIVPEDPVPLGHDGYLKLWSLSKPDLHRDFILLDEAQDTNEAVLSVLRRQSAQLTLVGDRHQQIYEWRGAVNAMASFPTQSESALTQSFRFGSAIATAATKILRQLGEARTLIGNPERRSEISGTGWANTVLCRTNAGVISVVVGYLSERRKPHVVGGVAELIRMLEDVTRLKRGDPAESPDFFGFSNWAEVVEFSQSDEGESLRTFVRIVSEHGEESLISALRTVAATEQAADVIVSTGHKAKGREWDVVRIHSDFEPRKVDKQTKKPILNEEEIRLLYVAATRARLKLIVPSAVAAFWNGETARAPEPAHVPVVQAHTRATTAPSVAAPTSIPKAPSGPPPLPPGARTVPQHTGNPAKTAVTPVAPPKPSLTESAKGSENPMPAQRQKSEGLIAAIFRALFR